MVFTTIYAYLNIGIRYSLTVLTIFYSIGILSLYGVFFSVNQKSISLNKIFNLFYYFFFFLAPTIQYKNNSVFFYKGTLSDQLYFKSGIILLVILIFYLVLYHLLFTFFNSSIKKKKVKNVLETKLNIYALYFISISAVLFYFYLIKFNWNLLIFRPFSFRLKFNTNLGLIGYAILLVVKLIPFIIVVYYKLNIKKNNIHTFCFLFLMMMTCFPSSLDRGILAMIYLPILVIFIPKLHVKHNFTKIFILGLLIVFPLLNNLRHLYEGQLNLNYELFDSGHFDAFQNFALLIENKIITNGEQLLGSIFFFIQEAQWENRPDGTGCMLAKTLDYNYTNVAMPYFGEGFANFGYWGVLIFLLVIVTFNAFLDQYYYKQRMKIGILVIYFIFLGLEFYLLRGDLMSSIKIITSFGLSISIVEVLVKLKKRLNFKNEKF